MANDKSRAAQDQTPVLQVNTTQEAPYSYIEPGNSLTPWNWVNFYGIPGHTVNFGIDNADADILDQNGDPVGTSYQIVLDNNGNGKSRVRAKPPVKSANVSELLSVTLTAYDTKYPSYTALGYPTFINYHGGNIPPGYLHISGYRLTTGAPNDGETPCSLYLRTRPDPLITCVAVTVDGGASVVGHETENPPHVKLAPDGCATVNIVNKSANRVNVTFSFPESPYDGAEATRPPPIVFSAFPNK